MPNTVEQQNVEAAASRLRACDLSEPPTEEMKAAWDDFKRTGLFAVLLGHLERADKLLASEGTIWGFFYNGYLAGYKATRPMFLTNDKIKMVLESQHGQETVRQ